MARPQHSAKLGEEGFQLLGTCARLDKQTLHLLVDLEHQVEDRGCSKFSPALLAPPGISFRREKEAAGVSLGLEQGRKMGSWSRSKNLSRVVGLSRPRAQGVTLRQAEQRTAEQSVPSSLGSAQRGQLHTNSLLFKSSN